MNRRGILSLVAIIIVVIVAGVILTWPKIDNNSPFSATSDTKMEANPRKDQTKISDLVNSKSKGSKNLADIYSPENFKNKDFSYNPDVDKIESNNSALNISSGDLDRMYNHYAAEYLANKYKLSYTLQDIIDWVKMKYKEPEPKTLEDVVTAEWTNIQLQGWDQVALDNELSYVQELASKKLYDEKSKSMSEDEIRDALETYGPNLRNNGWKDEDKIRSQSIMLYITTKEGISEEYIEDAHIYAEMKMLKLFLPEKYDELIKNQDADKIRNDVKNKMTPEGDL